MDITSTVIGYVLFSISEILPFINVPTSGILHTFILGFKNAFTNPAKDIELAEILVSKPDFAHIINTISTNPQIKTLIESLLSNPQLSNSLQVVTSGNNMLDSQLPILTSRPQLQMILTALIKDPQFCNNIASLINNPQLLNVYFQNKDLITNLSNNTQLISSLPLLTPQNLTILHELDTQNSNTISNILHSENKHSICNIVDILVSHPDLIQNINGLVNQAIV